MGGDDVDHLDRLATALGHLNLQHDLRALRDGGEPEYPQDIPVKKDVALPIVGYHEAVSFGGVKPFYMTAYKHFGNFVLSAPALVGAA